MPTSREPAGAARVRLGETVACHSIEGCGGHATGAVTAPGVSSVGVLVVAIRLLVEELPPRNFENDRLNGQLGN